MGTARHKLIDVVSTSIVQVCADYEETVTTTPAFHLRSMYSMQLSMYAPTPYPRLSTVKGLLRYCTVSQNRCSNLMLSLEDVHHVREMAWIWGSRDTVVGIKCVGTDGDVWKRTLRLFRAELGMGTFLRREADLFKEGNNIFPQCACQFAVGRTMVSSLKSVGSIPIKDFEDLHRHVCTSSPGVWKLKMEDIREMWSPIFNEEFLDVDGRGNSGGHSSFSKILKLLMEYV